MCIRDDVVLGRYETWVSNAGPHGGAFTASLKQYHRVVQHSCAVNVFVDAHWALTGTAFTL